MPIWNKLNFNKPLLDLLESLQRFLIIQICSTCFKLLLFLCSVSQRGRTWHQSWTSTFKWVKQWFVFFPVSVLTTEHCFPAFHCTSYIIDSIPECQRSWTDTVFCSSTNFKDVTLSTCQTPTVFQHVYVPACYWSDPIWPCLPSLVLLPVV